MRSATRESTESAESTAFFTNQRNKRESFPGELGGDTNCGEWPSWAILAHALGLTFPSLLFLSCMTANREAGRCSGRR